MLNSTLKAKGTNPTTLPFGKLWFAMQRLILAVSTKNTLLQPLPSCWAAAAAIILVRKFFDQGQDLIVNLYVQVNLSSLHVSIQHHITLACCASWIEASHTASAHRWEARCSCSWLITFLLGLRLSFNLSCVAKFSSCCRACRSCAQSTSRIENFFYPTGLKVLEEIFFTCLCFLSWQKHDRRKDTLFWRSWKWQSQWNLLWARSSHPADTTHLKNWSTTCCTWPCGIDTMEVACASSTNVNHRKPNLRHCNQQIAAKDWCMHAQA